MNGLVLEGGGARGSYHVGAVKALRKKHIKIDAVVGTSIGSINGAFVASNNYKKLKKLWFNNDSKSIFGVDQNILNAFKTRNVTKEVIKSGVQTVYNIIKNSGIDINILKNILNKNLNESEIRKSKIDFGLVTYNISKKKSIKIFKKDIPNGKLIDYLIASSYLPIFKFEKIIDENFYVDGGVLDRCPVDMLLDKKMETIYVVRSYLNKLPKYKTSSNIVEIMPYRKLGSIIGFDKESTKLNFLLGYYDTLKSLNKLDGYEYYFKEKSDEYYKSLFNKSEKLKIYKKYNKNVIIIDDKKIIIKTLEEICKYYKINRFRVYSIPFLIIKLKIINILKNDTIYSKFIEEIKVRFK